MLFACACLFGYCWSFCFNCSFVCWFWLLVILLWVECLLCWLVGITLLMVGLQLDWDLFVCGFNCLYVGLIRVVRFYLLSVVMGLLLYCWFYLAIVIWAWLLQLICLFVLIWWLILIYFCICDLLITCLLAVFVLRFGICCWLPFWVCLFSFECFDDLLDVWLYCVCELVAYYSALFSCGIAADCLLCWLFVDLRVYCFVLGFDFALVAVLLAFMFAWNTGWYVVLYFVTCFVFATGLGFLVPSVCLCFWMMLIFLHLYSNVALWSLFCIYY